ncbi:MAG TPA: ABC transporter permease [Vicinamibacteria bacterium]|nr:ABC transporter permease [Vicinamibacteria bacterium]
MNASPRVLLRLGVRSLLVHKLRSVLSILGVVFGVAAVTAVSAVGEGARREAVAQIGSLGIDTLTVRARPAAGAASTPGAAAPTGLRLREAEAVQAVVPNLVATAPVREASLSAEAGGRTTDAAVVGTTAAYRDAARLRLSAGRFLTDLDVEDRKRVAVLGASIANTLFPFEAPVGQRLALGGDWYDVVGVVEGRAVSRARTGPIRSRDVNRAVFVPLAALDRGSGRADGVDEIVLRIDDSERVGASAEVARRVVERTTGGAPIDVIVPREILRQKERTQRIFNVVTGAIAAISLLVGGIGIMNIMLASVAERTREVGIRRAVGAARRDIAAQFLVESSLLTSAGGVIGAVLGVAGSMAIQALAGWPTALSPGMLLAGLVVALAVGIGFGFYPAWHAAHLEPMEALRSE